METLDNITSQKLISATSIATHNYTGTRYHIFTMHEQHFTEQKRFQEVFDRILGTLLYWGRTKSKTLIGIHVLLSGEV